MASVFDRGDLYFIDKQERTADKRRISLSNLRFSLVVYHLVNSRRQSRILLELLASCQRGNTLYCGAGDILSFLDFI